MQHPSVIERFAYSARRVTRTLDNRDGTTTQQIGGTAFVVAHPCGDTNVGFLVTASHVIWPKLGSDKPDVRRTIGLTLESHESAGGRAYEQAQVEIDTSAWPEPTEDGVSVFPAEASSGVVSGGYKSIIVSSDLWSRNDFEESGFIGREVIVAGYPDSILPDGATPRPIISSGVIASDPRWSAGVARRTSEHSALYQGFSWSGMSGAPVLAQQVGMSSSATINFSGSLPAGVIGVSFGHVQAVDSNHSSWSGLFPSWLILDKLAEYETAMT